MAESEKLFPQFPSANVADGRGVNVEVFSQVDVAKIGLSDPENIGFGELGPSALFSGVHPSSFQSFVDVDASSPDVKTARMAANRPIAVMEDIQTIWDGAMMNAIGGLMCEGQPHFAIRRHAELAVSLVGGGWPVPAPFRRRLTGHEPSKYFSFTKSSGTSELFPRKRVSVPELSMVVGRAQALTASRVAAERAFHAPNHRWRSF